MAYPLCYLTKLHLNLHHLFLLYPERGVPFWLRGADPFLTIEKRSSSSPEGQIFSSFRGVLLSLFTIERNPPFLPSSRREPSSFPWVVGSLLSHRREAFFFSGGGRRGFLSGMCCSSVSIPALGAGGRRFESYHPETPTDLPMVTLLFLLSPPPQPKKPHPSPS